MNKAYHFETIKHFISHLMRPKTLIKACRFALSDYNRNRDLPVLLRSQSLSNAQVIIDKLIALEGKLENARLTCKSNYSISRHIQVLTALIYEVKQSMPNTNTKDIA